ncbi:MAG: hypothetical protein IT539_01465 [Bradyrhizobiaceae bacterium]|nr:hypothetical protein [Bradyrhizobiaceae bacterium]
MTAQLGFEALLSDADAANSFRAQERECADLPGTMEEALPFYRALLERHHAAMLACDLDAAMVLREDAHRLARKLNNFEPGILASDNAPGRVLDRLTKAPEGTVPLWGQSGAFTIACDGMRVRIEMGGLFGIGASFSPCIGFTAHAVDWAKPFLSETGYRSFLGASAGLLPGWTPEESCRAVIAAYVRRELKGRLPFIRQKFAPATA